MVDAPTTQIDSPKTPPPDPELGHLAGLHKMSRTAGVGGGINEYSAVNVMAVVAVLVAGASALALVTPFFLLLAVVGVILAVVAIVQIRSSNGTQTGLPLAIIALVLSGTFSGISGYKYSIAVVQEKADIQAIDKLFNDFGRLLAEKKWDEAYQLTDARFRDNVTVTQVQNLFEELDKSPRFGKLTGARTNQLFQIEIDQETPGVRVAVGNGLFDTEKMNGENAIKTEVRFRYTADAWKIFSIPQFFQAKGAAAGGGGGGGGGQAGPPQPAGPPRP